MQGVVDALQSGETGRRNGAGMPQIQPNRHMRDAFGCDRNVFGIEAALRIVPTVRIDFVALVKPADVRSDCRHSAGPVGAQRGKCTSPSGDQPTRMSASHEPAPAVCSAISTSPTSGTGTGGTWIVSTSGPPNWSIAAARMVSGMALILCSHQTMKPTTPPSTRSAAPVVAESAGEAR
jgi:hypothetical protein